MSYFEFLPKELLEIVCQYLSVQQSKNIELINNPAQDLKSLNTAFNHEPLNKTIVNILTNIKNGNIDPSSWFGLKRIDHDLLEKCLESLKDVCNIYYKDYKYIETISSNISGNEYYFISHKLSDSIVEAFTMILKTKDDYILLSLCGDYENPEYYDYRLITGNDWYKFFNSMLSAAEREILLNYQGY